MFGARKCACACIAQGRGVRRRDGRWDALRHLWLAVTGIAQWQASSVCSCLPGPKRGDRACSSVEAHEQGLSGDSIILVGAGGDALPHLQVHTIVLCVHSALVPLLLRQVGGVVK